MPLSSDPNATFPYILKTDRGKPDPVRFNCRFMTRSERRKMLRLAEEAFKETDDAKTFTLLMAAIRVCVTGWTAGKPFTDEVLSDDLSDLELWELAREVPTAALDCEREKKASASSSTSVPARSAPDAAVGDAAQTNPPS
jgi:hypothetical protein